MCEGSYGYFNFLEKPQLIESLSVTSADDIRPRFPRSNSFVIGGRPKFSMDHDDPLKSKTVFVHHAIQTIIQETCVRLPCDDQNVVINSFCFGHCSFKLPIKLPH